LNTIGKALVLVLLAGSVSAQSVFTRTNEYSGNVSASEAISGIVGTYRFTLQSKNGGEDYAPDATVRFVLTDKADGLVRTNAVTTVTATGMYRAETTIGARANPTMQALPYDVQFVAYPLDSDPVIMWWASLTVTSAPSAGATVALTVSNAAPLQFGYDGGTNAPGFVRLYGGGTMATGAVDGANLSLYLTGGGEGGGGIVSNVTPGDVSSWNAGTGALVIDTNANLRSGGASINGAPITNGGDIIVSSGGGENGYLAWFTNRWKHGMIAPDDLTVYRQGPTTNVWLTYEHKTNHIVLTYGLSTNRESILLVWSNATGGAISYTVHATLNIKSNSAAIRAMQDATVFPPLGGSFYRSFGLLPYFGPLDSNNTYLARVMYAYDGGVFYPVNIYTNALVYPTYAGQLYIESFSTTFDRPTHPIFMSWINNNTNISWHTSIGGDMWRRNGGIGATNCNNRYAIGLDSSITAGVELPYGSLEMVIWSISTGGP